MKKLIAFALVVAAFATGYLISGRGKPSVPGREAALSDQIDCASLTGPTKPMAATKLYFEYNATDQDTGIHGGFDTGSFAELCIYDPSGTQILALKPQGALKKLAMGGIFFESREPNHKEITPAMHFADFPEGEYTVRGVDHEGYQLTGAATLTHAVPSAPVITSPRDNTEVPVDGVTVTWNPVTTSLDGRPITITGYEVIITKEVPDDPHGFSRPAYDVHVPPSVTSLSVPPEFLEPGTKYELEVLALETSGNQTITVQFFQTSQ